MKRLALMVCLMLLLAAPVAFAQYDGWGEDDWTYDTGSSSCCCGPTFILLAGATLFAYAHQRK